MFGVTYRKLGQLDKASDYLEQLQGRSEANHLPGTTATAVHHLAWVYIQKRELAHARQLAEQARSLYEGTSGDLHSTWEVPRTPDLRGLSDVDEQLGVIAWRENDLVQARR
ncbi:MAG: tetratricopeptide repeat protein [Chloroflexota bacterium]